MEVLLEVRVVGLDGRYAEPAREPQPREMRDERRVNVDQVELAVQRLDGALDFAGDDYAVFRVEGEVARPDANDARLIVPQFRVLRRDEDTRTTPCLEIPAKGLDRRGNAVHPGEVDIRELEDARRAHRHSAID